MNRKPTTFRKLSSIALSLGMVLTSVAFAQTSEKAAGELSVRGNVTLNGVAAISGATVFSGGTIRTAENGSATVNLGRLGRVELAPNSELVVNYSADNIGGALRAGRVTVNAPGGVGISVMTADGNAVADGSRAAAVTVDVSCGATRVAASRSDVKVTSGSRTEYVAAGQEVAVGAQAQAPRCTRLVATAAAAGGAGTGLSAGAIAALIIAGVGGAVAGIVAASQSDSTNANTVVVSSFRP
jgi:hypothetical protein